jgi:hypothetical protein
MRGTVIAGTAVTVFAVAFAGSGWADSDALSKRPRGVVADCSKGSGIGRGNLSAFRSQRNLVVGPLAMTGAADIPGGYSTAFGGNKFPLYVLGGHRVTLSLTPGTRGRAGLAYGPLPKGEVQVPEAHRAITFIACRPGQYSPGWGGTATRVSFWAGGVVAVAPRCVPLLIWVDNERSPRRAVIHLGVTDCG